LFKILFATTCLLVVSSAALAQDKIEGKWHCKPTGQQKYDVGDQPDHIFGIAKGTCDATGNSLNEKSGAWTETSEVTKTTAISHGRFIATTDSGDKIFYTYEVTSSLAKKTGTNKLRITSGTGKYKGIKGSVSCDGTFDDDRNSDWNCTGTYTTAPAK
jgi:hypothetical protein